MEDVVKDYGYIPGVEKEWVFWRDNMAPLSDDSAQYCGMNELHVPFIQELFAGSKLNCERYNI